MSCRHAGKRVPKVMFLSCHPGSQGAAGVAVCGNRWRKMYRVSIGCLLGSSPPPYNQTQQTEVPAPHLPIPGCNSL